LYVFKNKHRKGQTFMSKNLEYEIKIKIKNRSKRILKKKFNIKKKTSITFYNPWDVTCS